MLARSLAEEYPGTLLLDLVVTVGGRHHAIEANCAPTPKPTRPGVSGKHAMISTWNVPG